MIANTATHQAMNLRSPATRKCPSTVTIRMIGSSTTSRMPAVVTALPALSAPAQPISSPAAMTSEATHVPTLNSRASERAMPGPELSMQQPSQVHAERFDEHLDGQQDQDSDEEDAQLVARETQHDVRAQRRTEHRSQHDGPGDRRSHQP